MLLPVLFLHWSFDSSRIPSGTKTLTGASLTWRLDWTLNLISSSYSFGPRHSNEFPTLLAWVFYYLLLGFLILPIPLWAVLSIKSYFFNHLDEFYFMLGSWQIQCHCLKLHFLILLLFMYSSNSAINAIICLFRFFGLFYASNHIICNGRYLFFISYLYPFNSLFSSYYNI